MLGKDQLEVLKAIAAHCSTKTHHRWFTDPGLFSQELARLEKRLDELVVICNQLKEENRSLKDRQDTLIADRATLLQKNEQVRARVEAMISRLKAMEQG